MAVVSALLSGAFSADPVATPYVLPSSSYAGFSNVATTSTGSDKQIDNLSLVRAPNSLDATGSESLGISSRAYSGGDATALTGAGSVTSQAVVNGMNLQKCVDEVKKANSQYQSFDSAITQLAGQVRQSKVRLDAVDILTHNIQSNQDNFESELSHLKDLYNTLAIRSNALGKWMSDEKMIRDNLQELYRAMAAKNTEEEQRLLLMSASMRTAVSRLAQVNTDTASILQSVASAQAAMYDWAANVTVAANEHTTKLESLQSALQYRITQIDQVIPEMRNVAKRTIYIARSLGETNLAYAAANVLTHVESVLNSVNMTDTVMSIPA
jgi:chromosome segregation ATPase